MQPHGGGYHAVHQWLRLHHGKATKCENSECAGRGKRFEWALIHGKKYEHKRENFWQLCKPCHSKYDGIDRLAHRQFWKGGKPNCGNCGKSLSTYTAKLCGTCNRKLNPPWLGKSRRANNLKQHGLLSG